MSREGTRKIPFGEADYKNITEKMRLHGALSQ